MLERRVDRPRQRSRNCRRDGARAQATPGEPTCRFGSAASRTRHCAASPNTATVGSRWGVTDLEEGKAKIAQIKQYAEEASRDWSTLGFQAAISPPPRPGEASDKTFYSEPEKVADLAATLKEAGFGWSTINRHRRFPRRCPSRRPDDRRFQRPAPGHAPQGRLRLSSEGRRTTTTPPHVTLASSRPSPLVALLRFHTRTAVRSTLYQFALPIALLFAVMHVLGPGFLASLSTQLHPSTARGPAITVLLVLVVASIAAVTLTRTTAQSSWQTSLPPSTHARQLAAILAAAIPAALPMLFVWATGFHPEVPQHRDPIAAGTDTSRADRRECCGKVPRQLAWDFRGAP